MAGLGLIGVTIMLAFLFNTKKIERKRVIIGSLVAIASVSVLAFFYSFAGHWLMPDGIFQCFNLY